MRALTIKQAQKWLEKIKEADPNAYRDLSKCLRKYDKTSDQLECFQKINEALFTLPALTQQINLYLDDGNKFAVNHSLQQRLNSFLHIVRSTKHELFKEIVDYVNKIVNQDKNITSQPDEQVSKILKAGLIQIVKNYPHLIVEAEKMLANNPQEAIKKLDLVHLKNKGIVVYQEEQQSGQKQTTIKKIKKDPIYIKPVEIEKVKEFYKIKTTIVPSFLTASQEKLFIKQLEKKLGSTVYRELIKILSLYSHNVISRIQFVEIVGPVVGSDLQRLRDIIQSREIDRRKNSLFKPLSDIDFHILARQTHSYVQMPATYPHYAANRNQQNLSILNNKWVSVPRGSEDTFNVRAKNVYQMLLNKCEDERYQFDVVIRKFRKSIEILNSVLEQLQADENKNVTHQLNTVFSLGILQLLYKNSTKQQKQILEEAADNNLFALVRVFTQRMKKVLDQLQQNKKLYAIKMWNEVAQKNFQKSLDFKNHEFKRIEKLKLRNQTFIDEINSNIQYLQSRGAKRINFNPFEEKRQFFSILNSFETSSRKQRCISRKLPIPLQYNLKDHRLPTLLPAMILSFEDQEVMLAAYSFVVFYLENAILNESEKIRCKNSFRQIMNQFFKLKSFQLRSLSSHFDEERFFSEIFLNGESAKAELINVDAWIQSDSDKQTNSNPVSSQTDKTLAFKSVQDIPSQYSFQPPKTDENIVFYATQNFYVFLRFLYALYERIIRMRQVAESELKMKLFQILYFACIKVKEGARFQDSLNYLFGEYAYLFTTIYKIIEGLSKSLSAISISPIEYQSFSLLGIKNEEVYLLLLNRFMLGSSTNTPRLMRFAYEFNSHLLYISSFNSYYRFSEDNMKEFNKKRQQISKYVEIFNSKPDQIRINPQLLKLKPSSVLNNQQYYFESSSSKLVNISNFEDIIISQRKIEQKQFQKQLAKIKKIRIQLF